MPKFSLCCEQELSTPHQDIKRISIRTIEFDRKPKRKDFPEIELALELQFIKDAGRRRKNILYISYKVKKVLG